MSFADNDYIISTERYEKYDDKDENRRWKEWLEEEIAGGKMTKGEYCILVVAPRVVVKSKVVICTNQNRFGDQCALRSVWK